MHRFNSLMIGVVLLCVGWTMPTPAHATIDWEETFEYADPATMWAIWDESCQHNPALSTLRPYRGLKSIRLVFTGKVAVDPGAGGCFMHRYLSAPSDTLYARWYMYMDNFTVDAGHTKMTLHGQAAKQPSVWWAMYWGGSVMSATVQGIIRDDGVGDSVQVYANAPIPHDQWVCMETRLTMSTPGVDNGIVQAWINGTSVINKTNQRMRAATHIANNYPDTQFKLISLYVQNGRGVIYYDDYAVSRDARIGCTASPSGDRQAPRAPSDFSFK
jgi:hypothetical protein